MSSSSTDPKAPFTASDGRRFAFPVGLAFLALGGLAYWRGGAGVAYGFGGVAVALLAAGLVLPSKLGPVHRGWMSMALLISRFTTPIFMAIVYFLVITPAGLLMRLVGRNPMVHRAGGEGFWRSTEGREKGDLRRQF